jgi:hypothetical protein
MIDVLVGRKDTWTQALCVKMEEDQRMLLQTKEHQECQQAPKAWRSMEHLLPEPPEEPSSCQQMSNFWIPGL